MAVECGEGCQWQCTEARSVPPYLQSLQGTAAVYRFQCTWDTLNWCRRMRWWLKTCTDFFFPLKLCQDHIRVSSYQKKKQFPNHCLPQAEEEDKIPTLFNSFQINYTICSCIFSHLLRKSRVLILNQTYANICKLLMALLMLGCENRDRNTVQGATGGRLNY